MSLFLFLLALFPAVVLFLIVYFGDRIEREPIGLLFGLIGLGMASTIPAMIMELLGEGGATLIGFIIPGFSSGGVFYEFFINFFVVAFSEELVKFLMTFALTWKNKNFDHSYDGVLYAVSTSLGFALLENVLYVFSTTFSDGGVLAGVFNGVSRAFLAVPMHTGVAIFMGYFYGRAKAETYKRRSGKVFGNIVLSLLIPMLIHGFYDFVLSVNGVWNYVIFFVFVAGMYVFTIIMGIHFARHNKNFTGRIKIRVTKDGWLRYIVTEQKEIMILGLTKPYTAMLLRIPAEIDGCPVRYIGRSAFAYTNLVDVQLPQTIRDISDMAFFNCPYLREVILPNKIHRIGNYAFEYCYSLQRFLLPFVDEIGDHIFDGCDNLTDVYYLGSPADWQRIRIRIMENHKFLTVRFYYRVVRR